MIPPGGHAAGKYATWLESLPSVGSSDLPAEVLVVGHRGDQGHPARVAQAWAEQLDAHLELLTSRAVYTDVGAGDELARRFSRLRTTCQPAPYRRIEGTPTCRSACVSGRLVARYGARLLAGPLQAPLGQSNRRRMASRSRVLGQCAVSATATRAVDLYVGECAPQPWRPTKPQCSAFKSPGNHQRELLSPELAAVRPDPLCHDNVGTCTCAARLPTASHSRGRTAPRVPATRYTRGSELGITAGGL